MILHALLLALLIALGTAQRCSFSGERKSRDGRIFERCELGQIVFTGCVDADGSKVSDGDEFDHGTRSLCVNRQRYRLKCSVTNTAFSSSLKGRLVGCYDIDGKLAAKGEDYLWYYPLYRHSRYARFTRRCQEEDDGSFGFRNVACRGAKDERIEFGESYQPKADDPDFIFDCVGNSTSASFNLRGSAADDSAESSGELQDASAEARRERLEHLISMFIFGGGGGLDLSGCRCSSPPCLSASETYFYRCEGRDQVVLGCADEEKKLVEDGDVFRSKDKGGNRFLLSCKVRNDTPRFATSVEMLGCYDSADVLKNPGEEFSRFGSAAGPFSELIGYTKLCLKGEDIDRHRHLRDRWHQRNRAVEGLAATNNAVEASHRRLQTHLRVRHPTLWLFMEELKKLLRADEARLVHLAGGGAPEKMAPKYRTRATRLAALCARPFPPDDPGRLDFLKAVSHLHKH